MRSNSSSWIYIACAFLLVSTNSFSQRQRALGIGALMLDNGTQPMRTITIDVPPSLLINYSLHLPPAPPPLSANILKSDAQGNLYWSDTTMPLPPLAQGNLWIGDATGMPMAFAPTGAGAILTIDGSNMPVWSYAVPDNTTLSVAQLTSGTLEPGVTLTVGAGSVIEPTDGTITANSLNGAGIGKYTGTISIPQDALMMSVSFPTIAAGATVLLNISDQNLPGVLPFLQAINAGSGFDVVFSAQYPTSTGSLVYTIINP
jgi:hypothetical protein